MRADVAALGSLFGDRRGFAAPFHQRPYRWSAARNWAPFWAQWTAAADADAAKSGRRLNFLGAVVCRADADASARDGPDDALRRLEVLDGQQRLLTAMMALKALSLHARRIGAGALAERLDALLFDAEGRPRFIAGRASYADQMAALRTIGLTPRPAMSVDEATRLDDLMADDAHQGDAGGAGVEDAEDFDDDAEDERDPFEAFDRGERIDAEDAEDNDAEESETPDPREADAEWLWDDASGAGAARLRVALRHFFDLVERRLAAARESQSSLRGRGAAAAQRAELERLADALLEKSQVVLITLDGDISAFDVFERLNNLGEPLSALDLVKNKLFKAAELAGLERPALEALYRAHWRIFDDARNTRFWAAVERRGREKRPTQDWFLRAYLSVRERRSVSMNETLDRMHEIASAAEVGAPAEIESLCSGARAFAEIAGHLDPGPHRARIEALRRFARFAAEPALVAMRMHLWRDAQATEDVLALLESVAVRRFFCVQGTGKDYEVYARLASVIGPSAAQNGKSCVREVARRLRSAQKGAFWPRDGAFKRAFATKKLANRNSSHQARDRKAVFRAVYSAIDAVARGADPSEPTPWRRQSKTVEHLFPLHGRDHWPEISRNDADLLETIGNLTLIDDALNKQMGQAPWSKKRSLIDQDAGVTLNELLLSDKRWRKEWGPKQIRERGRALAQLAVARWPRPR